MEEQSQTAKFDHDKTTGTSNLLSFLSVVVFIQNIAIE